jgi:hypothetical protein
MSKLWLAFNDNLREEKIDKSLGRAAEQSAGD